MVSKEETYYMGDRVYYQPPPSSEPTATHVVVEQKKVRNMGCCMWIATALFIVLIIFLVICLILFFTWHNDSDTTVKSASLISGPLTNHIDKVSPGYVLTAQKTKTPEICLFDVGYFGGGRALYREGHLPGARHFDIDRVTKKTATQRTNLVHPLEFQKYVRGLGVDHDCHVIIYDHGENDIAIVAATYVWWLFKVYGHNKVSIMDGGLKAWKSNGEQSSEFKVTRATPKPVPQGNFKANWNSNRIITFPDVLDNFDKEKYQVIDARKVSEFNGAEKYQFAAEAGRIKGAINIPTPSLLNKNGALKSLNELRNIVNSKGVSKKPVIAYCNIGMQASTLYFVLSQLGIEAVVYDGSWVEWSFLAPPQLKIRS